MLGMPHMARSLHARAHTHTHTHAHAHARTHTHTVFTSMVKLQLLHVPKSLCYFCYFSSEKQQPSLDFNVVENQISIKLNCDKNQQILTILSSQTNTRHYTSGCHRSSIPLTGSVLWAVLRLVLAASFCWTGCDSFFFLLAPKQPKLSPEKRKQTIYKNAKCIHT